MQRCGARLRSPFLPLTAQAWHFGEERALWYQKGTGSGLDPATQRWSEFLSSNKGKSNTFFISFRGRVASRTQSVTIAEQESGTRRRRRGEPGGEATPGFARSGPGMLLQQPPRSTSSEPKCALQPPRGGRSRLGGLRGGGGGGGRGGSARRRTPALSLARWGRRGAAGPGAARTPRSAAAPGLRAAGLPGAAPTRAGPDRRGCHGSSSITDRRSPPCRRRASGRTARIPAGGGRGAQAPTLTPAAPRRGRRRPGEEFNHFPP